MSAAQTTALLVLGLLAVQPRAEPASCLNDEQAEEAIDDDVHEVQLMQLAHVTQAVSDTRRQHVAVQLTVSQEGIAAEAASLPPKGGQFGLPGCNCIGIDYPGTATAQLDHPTHYPAGIGSKCNAWDQANDRACKVKHPPAYCSQKWCYVDGCACNTSEVPKIASYFPNATFQGTTLYYSYETCNATDNWTSSHNKGACVMQKSKADCVALTKCSWNGATCTGKELQNIGACQNPAPAQTIGSSACRCIGISNLSGTVKAHINNKLYDYPADFGSSCKAWDDQLHPSCGGAPQPFWCEQRWCYVDPCSCHLDVVPKHLTYVPSATFQGRALFYSYRTCGEEDTYSREENDAACPTRPSQYQCELMTNCSWAGTRGCVHKDILAVCGEAGLEALPRKSAAELNAKTVVGMVAMVIGFAAWN